MARRCWGGLDARLITEVLFLNEIPRQLSKAANYIDQSLLSLSQDPNVGRKATTRSAL